MSWMRAPVKPHRPCQLFLTTVIVLSVGDPGLDLPGFCSVDTYIGNILGRQEVGHLEWHGATTLGDFIGFVEGKHGVETLDVSAFHSLMILAFHSHLVWPSIALSVETIESSPILAVVPVEPESDDAVDSLSKVPKGY